MQTIPKTMMPMPILKRPCAQALVNKVQPCQIQITPPAKEPTPAHKIVTIAANRVTKITIQSGIKQMERIIPIIDFEDLLLLDFFRGNSSSSSYLNFLR